MHLSSPPFNWDWVEAAALNPNLVNLRWQTLSAHCGEIIIIMYNIIRWQTLSAHCGEMLDNTVPVIIATEVHCSITCENVVVMKPYSS